MSTLVPPQISVFRTFSSPDKTDSLSLHGACFSVQEKKSHPAKAVVRCVFPRRQQQCVYDRFHLTLKVSFVALCYNEHTAPMVESLPFFIFLDNFCENLQVQVVNKEDCLYPPVYHHAGLTGW